jgi:hypothetical protein
MHKIPDTESIRKIAKAYGENHLVIFGWGAIEAIGGRLNNITPYGV